MRNTRSRRSEAFAFDLDGTLISCRERQIAAARIVARSLGVKLPDENRFWNAKRRGRSTFESLRELGFETELARTFAGEWVARVEEVELLRQDQLFPRSRSSLDRVRREGYSPVVITARVWEDRVRRQLARLGLAAHIDQMFVVPPDGAARSKATILKQINSVAYVGDSELDCAAAIQVGVPFAAVASGQRHARFLRGHLDAPVYPDVERAVNFLLARISRRCDSVGRRSQPAGRCKQP